MIIQIVIYTLQHQLLPYDKQEYNSYSNSSLLYHHQLLQ